METSLLKMLKRKASYKINRVLYGSSYNAQNATSKYYGIGGKIKAAAAINRVRFSWKKNDCPKLKALKDIHRHQKRGFIICNGPSLNKLDLVKLRNEVTLCANGII
ncbi:MAG: hypothetical protein GY765_30605 [bacterium]|nr:hypothetical protein [bacterium]